MSEVIKPILLDETGQAINETLNKIYGKMVGSDVSDATAVAGDILFGKTAYGPNGKMTGTIPSKDGTDVAVSDNVVTVPAGHYASQAQKTVGTVQAAQTITPTTTDQTIAAGKYLTGAQTIKGDANLVAGNIKKDVAIFGVTGSYEGGGGGGGGGGGSKGDVTFYDYDGSIVTSYSAADFVNLSALPANPTHSGLTAQGWNWTLADAKTYVASYGKLNIGQMYTTSDGKTRIYIRLEEGRLAPYLGIAIDGTATVDWGDGQTSTVTGSSTVTVVNTQHSYAAAGDYIIAIAVTGSMALVGHYNYGSRVLWKNSTTGNENKVYQSAIQKVEIGSNTSIGTYAFYYCYSLASVTIPSTVTSIGNYAFSGCYSLASVTIPSTVTSIGTYAFWYCYSLASVTIPSTVTSIGTYAFSGCYSLASVTIPSTVTSIGTYAFCYCYSLASVTIPSTVTSIGTSAFENCFGLGFIKFANTTPPTAGYNAWSSVPTDCVIYVPTGSLSAYKGAVNYPSSGTYTYIEY